MEYIKAITSGFFEFLFRKVVNYTAALLGIIALMMLFLSKDGTNPLSGPIPYWLVSVLFGFCAASVVWYVIQELVVNIQLLMFVGRTANKIEVVQHQIDDLPHGYKTLEAAKVFATDLGTIKYLERMNVVSAYEALSFGFAQFGYLLLPILTVFGIVNLSTYGISFWVFTDLWKWCLVAFGLRYLMIFAIAMAATGIADKYNRVIMFYAEKTTPAVPAQ